MVTTALLARSPAAATRAAQVLQSILNWKLAPPMQGKIAGTTPFYAERLESPLAGSIEIVSTPDIKWLWPDRNGSLPLALALLGVGLGGTDGVGAALLERRAGSLKASSALGRLGSALLSMDFSKWKGVPIPRPAIIASAASGGAAAGAATPDVSGGGPFFVKKETVLGIDLDSLEACEDALMQGSYAQVPQSLCLWERAQSGKQHWVRLIPGEYSSLVLHAAPATAGTGAGVGTSGSVVEVGSSSRSTPQDLPAELQAVLRRFGGSLSVFSDGLDDERQQQEGGCCRGACGRADVSSCEKWVKSQAAAATSSSAAPSSSRISASLYGVRRGDMSTAQVRLYAPELAGLDLRFCAAARPSPLFAEPPDTIRDDVDPALNDPDDQRELGCRSVTGLVVTSQVKKRLGVRF